MLAVVLSMSRRVPDSGSEDDGELHSALQRIHRTVPDLCSSAHRQIRIFSARVPDLFGTLHGLPAECGKHQGETMRRCAQTCQRCAAACAEVANGPAITRSPQQISKSLYA